MGKFSNYKQSKTYNNPDWKTKKDIDWNNKAKQIKITAPTISAWNYPWLPCSPILVDPKGPTDFLIWLPTQQLLVPDSALLDWSYVYICCQISYQSYHGNGYLNVLKIRYEAGESSFNILIEIDDLLKRQKDIEWSNKQRPLGMVRSSTGPSTSQTYYDVNQKMFPSKKMILIDIFKLLEDDNKVQMIGLCGMGEWDNIIYHHLKHTNYIYA